MHLFVDNLIPVKNGIKDGKVIQLDSGTLINISYANFTVSRSTNDGHTWTQVYQDTNAGQGLLIDEDSNHNVYVGSHKLGVQTVVLRSTDDGQTFNPVFTSDASAWHFAEDPTTGYLYINEYSIGNQDAFELYAYNIWRSTDHGATWSIWLTYPHQSTPGAKDGIRHIHGVFCDSTGQKYSTAGDTPNFVSSYVNTMYKLNNNGTFGQLVDTFANGPICFCEIGNGTIYLGSDFIANGTITIYRYHPNTNTYESTIDVTAAHTAAYTAPFYTMFLGKDGVIYAYASNDNSKRGGLFVSADDGVTWHLFDKTGYWGAGSIILNKDAANPKIFISNADNNYRVMPDLTRKQVNSFITGNRIRRQVDWANGV